MSAQEQIAPELVERMAALVRGIWDSGSLYYAKEVEHLYAEACAIKVLLPDSDLMMAREIGAACCVEPATSPMLIMRPEGWRKGLNDDTHKMRLILAALKRGRELASGS